MLIYVICLYELDDLYLRIFSRNNIFTILKVTDIEGGKDCIFPMPYEHCRIHQTCIYGDTFCICPTWHAYYASLKHNNFTCHLTSVSHIFPSFFLCKGHAKKAVHRKMVPFSTCLLSILWYLPCQIEALELDFC